jgi:hypothetical protein
LITGDTSYIPITIIDGNSCDAVININNVDSTCLITGFTIRNGSFPKGGGIYCNNGGNARISYNIIRDNHSDVQIEYGGGGICCDYSDPIITNNIISYNEVYCGSYGGGIFCKNSNPNIKNNIISHNSACWGGGIGFYDSNPLIVNNLIYENDADP